MLKEITPTYAVINSVSVSGATTVVSTVSSIAYRDSFAIEWCWAGNLQGTFTIDGSLNYSPGLPQQNVSGQTANPGDWASITLTSGGATSLAVGSATNFPFIFNCNQLAFPWVRTTFTNSTGSGLLTCYAFSKSLG